MTELVCVTDCMSVCDLLDSQKFGSLGFAGCGEEGGVSAIKVT